MKRSWRARIGRRLRGWADRIDRAPAEADDELKLFSWFDEIEKWTPTLRNLGQEGQRQFIVTPHNAGRSAAGESELRRLIEQGVLHVKSDAPYLTWDEEPEPGHPAYWWIQNKSPCFYKYEWTDEVGDILVCRIHKNNSRHEVTEGFDKPCLTVDPYSKEPDGAATPGTGADSGGA